MAFNSEKCYFEFARWRKFFVCFKIGGVFRLSQNSPNVISKPPHNLKIHHSKDKRVIPPLNLKIHRSKTNVSLQNVDRKG